MSATGGAVVTALGLKSLTKVRVFWVFGDRQLCPQSLSVTRSLLPPQHLPAIIGRYVPFAAVAAANCINIPLMRQRWVPGCRGDMGTSWGAVPSLCRGFGGGGGGAHTKRLVWGYQHLLASQELWVNASIPGCAHGVQPRAPTYHIVHGWGTWRDTDLPPCCVPDPLHPCCPYRELKVGIPITDENGNRLGESTAAAQKAIFQVVVSRIGMAAPAMGEYPALALAM